MVKLLLLFCLIFLSGWTRVDCKSREDWGLEKRGWTWLNWYHYWYWRHGTWGKISDHDTICQRLWGMDHNKMHRNVDYDLFLQAKVLKNSTVDKARRRLFRYVRMANIKKRPTYKTFTDLLDNFQPSNGRAARQNEKIFTIKENVDKFLTAVTETRVFQELYWYLVRNGLHFPNKAQFKQTLFDLWFNKGNITTDKQTTFQKVFVGETVFNPSKLSVRNWIQFYKLESVDKLNYYGYVGFFQYNPKVISVMFSWNRGAPLTDNMLIGTSPEFELALYTLCFFTRPGEECECKVNIKKIVVTTITSADGTRLINSHFEL